MLRQHLYYRRRTLMNILWSCYDVVSVSSKQFSTRWLITSGWRRVISSYNHISRILCRTNYFSVVDSFLYDTIGKRRASDGWDPKVKLPISDLVGYWCNKIISFDWEIEIVVPKLKWWNWLFNRLMTAKFTNQYKIVTQWIPDDERWCRGRSSSTWVLNIF